MSTQLTTSLVIADYYRRNWLYVALLLTTYFVLSMLFATRSTDAFIWAFITPSAVPLLWMFAYLTAHRAMLSLPIAASQYRKIYWWVSFAIPAIAFIGITIVTGSIAKLFWSATNFSTLGIALFLSIGGLGASFSRVKRGAFEPTQAIWPLLSLGIAITLAPYFIYSLVTFNVVSANMMLPLFSIFAGWYVLNALLYPHLAREHIFGLAPPRQTRKQLHNKQPTVYLRGWWSLVSLKITNGRPIWFVLNTAASCVFLFYLTKFMPIHLSTIMVVVAVMPMTQSKFVIEIARDIRVLPMNASVLAATLYLISLLPVLIGLPIILFAVPTLSLQVGFFPSVALCISLGGVQLPWSLWIHESRTSDLISSSLALLIYGITYVPTCFAVLLLMQHPLPSSLLILGAIALIAISCLWIRRQLIVGHGIYRKTSQTIMPRFG